MVVAGALLSAACGNVTSGGVGDVEVVLTSDEVVDLQTATLSLLESDPSRQTTVDQIRGTLSVTVRSHARRPNGEFEELTDGPQQVTVSLADPSPIEIVRREVPTGRYEAVRTIFGRIEANVESGLIVDGTPIDGVIPVDLGSLGTLSVVDLTGFDVVDSTPTVIALEMQSRVWLRLVDAALRRVEVDDFRRIFRVRIRQRLGGG